MKKLLVNLFILILALLDLKAQTGFIIDHRHTDISQIPDSWIDSAKKNLNVRYYRRSHGSQIDLGGMTALRNFSTEWASKYNFSSAGTLGALKLSTRDLCVDYDTTILYNEIRQFLANPTNQTVNIVMLAWSYDFYLKNIQAYLDTMENFIRDYGPDGLYIKNGNRTVPVTFVFQTACSHQLAARNIKIHFGNQLIRQHCISNNRVLFDFADIEAHNPDGEYFGDANPDGSYSGQKLLHDDISYKIDANTRGNWGTEWINSHPGTELSQLSANNICTSCAHSEISRLNCVMKGRAAWWLMAKLAGWNQQILSLKASVQTPLSEGNLNGSIINLELTGENFKDNSLLNSNLILSGVPSGCSIQSVTYLNSTNCQLVLAFNGTDFDNNINNFNITILAAELAGNANLISNNLGINALNESLAVSTNPSLTEANLNGKVINLTLSDDKFVDNSISISNIQLNNAPPGLSVSSISYIDVNNINITLNFNGTDFDVDINNFNIKVLAPEIVGNDNLISNNLGIDALNETLEVFTNPDMTEANLNGKVLNLTLSDDKFVDNSISISNIQLNNAPPGLSVSNISYIDENNLNITLNFNGTDFDNDINNFNITVLAFELAGNDNLFSNYLTIVSFVEESKVIISSTQTIEESDLNGANIQLTLSNDEFLNPDNPNGNFILLGAPKGLSIGNYLINSDTKANLTLLFDGTDFDQDSTNFQVLVQKSLLKGNSDLQSNKLIIYAEDESGFENFSLNSAVGIYPNPNNGTFKLSLKHSLSGNIFVKIFNLDGKTVYFSTLSPGQTIYDFELEYKAKGMYLILLENSGKLYSGSFIVD